MVLLQEVWELYQLPEPETAIHQLMKRKLGHDANSSALEDFMQELETYLTSSKNLVEILTAVGGNTSDLHFSLMGILLRVDVLQPRMIDLVLEKLSEYSNEVDRDILMRRNIPKLVLREIRWLDYIVDSRELTQKLLAALPAFPLSFQKDIIYMLPEIAGDEDSEIVVETLIDLIRSETNLVVSCVEALCNFNLASSQTSSIVKCVLERLDSSPLTDLPVLVRFLVQGTNTNNIKSVIEQLRKKLSATLSFRPDPVLQAREAVNEISKGNEEALILNAIVQGLSFREDLMKEFLAVLGAAEQPSDLFLLDLWVCFGVYHSMATWKQKVERALKKQIVKGTIQPGLMVESILSHGNALKASFPSLLSLAGTLLVMTHESSKRMGSLLYELLFEEYSIKTIITTQPTPIGASATAGGIPTVVSTQTTGSECAYYPGEVISSLLSRCFAHQGRQSPDAALDTLLVLVSDHVSYESHRIPSRLTVCSDRKMRLQMFLPMIRQMIDCVEYYNTNQVRKMYDLLFYTAGYQDSDLCNLLRKQAYHQEIRYRYLGIIGSVVRLKHLLVSLRETDRLEETQEEDEMGDQELRAISASTPSIEPSAGTVKAIQENLVGLYRNSVRDVKCLCFMLEELIVFVDQLDPKDPHFNLFIKLTFDYFVESLFEIFMSEFKWEESRTKYEKSVLNATMKTQLWFGLDDRAAPVYVKILELFCSPDRITQESIEMICPLMSLLLACARKRDDIESVECLLICPLSLVEKNIFEDLDGLNPMVQEAVMGSLFYAVNWIRCLLNFFSQEKSYQYRIVKTIARLDNLLTLEEIIKENLWQSPTFMPPSDLDTKKDVGFKAASGVLSKGPKKKKLKVSGCEDIEQRLQRMKDSYIPLELDVVAILSMPLALETVLSSTTNELNEEQSQQYEAFNLGLNGILFLVRLLESHLIQASHAAKKLPSFGTLGSSKSMKEGVKLIHQKEQPLPMDLLKKVLENGVLEAVGKVAHHLYCTTFSKGQQRDSSNQEEEEEQKEDEQTQEDENDQHTEKKREIILVFMKIVHVISQFQTPQVEEEGLDAHAKQLLKVQAIQVLLQPSITSSTIQAADKEDVTTSQEVRNMKECFRSLMKFQVMVQDSLDVAVCFMEALLGLLTLVYGYDASQVLSLQKKVYFFASSSNSSAASRHQVLATQVSRLARRYLEKNWAPNGSKDPKFALKRPELELFLRAYLYHGPLVIQNVQDLAIRGLLELAASHGQSSETFPTLTKKTVAIYHRVMLETLVAVTGRLDFTEGHNYAPLLLNYLAQAVLLFKLLVGMTKSFQKSALVSNGLKIGYKFVEIILTAMPLLNSHFRTHSERIIQLIADVQVATRRMQVLCTHGKLVRDSIVVAQVPKVKKLLEKFIYKGEELARENGVLEAYSTGVLKNRRLDGSTITKEEETRAQESSDTEEEDEDEEEEEVEELGREVEHEEEEQKEEEPIDTTRVDQEEEDAEEDDLEEEEEEEEDNDDEEEEVVRQTRRIENKKHLVDDVISSSDEEDDPTQKENYDPNLYEDVETECYY